MRILVADDDPVSRRVLEATLGKWGYDVVAAFDGAEALRILQEPDAPRLAILDWDMPGADGTDICRQLRKRQDKTYTYLILLTAKGAKEDLIAGLEAGADDYLVKPFDTYELRARLNVGRRILELQNQFLQMCEEIRPQAALDSLTGLWNHAAILEILEHELARARREKHAVGVVMGDLDHFKRINDNYGHLAGDNVLRETARRLRSVLRQYDAIGRYGGEEFLIILPGCDGQLALRLAERLRDSVRRMELSFGGQPIGVSISLGVSASTAPEPASATAVLHAADTALYRAKHAGRDRVELETPSNASAETIQQPLLTRKMV
jgi:diguanylate cyclase (GGDEF)-like protein